MYFSELEETLMLLPFSAACDILQRLPALLKRDYHTELLARLALCLIQSHYGPIVANKHLLSMLENVRTLAMEKISTLRVKKTSLTAFACILAIIKNDLIN